MSEQPHPYGDPSPESSGAPFHAPSDHPQTTTVLVLGILGLVVCQVLGVVAWVMGNRVVREIDESGGRYGGRSTANIGRILGMVATLLTVGVVVVGFGLATLFVFG